MIEVIPQHRADDSHGPHLLAFLDMIGWSEATILVNGSDDGYNVIVGGSLFQSYADHPRCRVYIRIINNYSTAAGRYQILARYFDHYKRLLKLPDFGKVSQDAIAIQMIKEQKAIDDINTGDICSAIEKCSNIWASFPGAGYKQREHKIEVLSSKYVAFLDKRTQDSLVITTNNNNKSSHN